MKRTLSILLCVAMMLTLASAAFAAGLGLSTAPVTTPLAGDGEEGGENPQQPVGFPTIYFDVVSDRTVKEDLKHVWNANGITFTADYINPSTSTPKLPGSDTQSQEQLIKGSKLTIEYPGMTYIEFICASPSMANNLFKDVTNATATINQHIVLIALPAATDSYSFTLVSGNAYSYAITVYTSSEAPVRTADQNAAENATVMIDRIGTVTLDSKDRIEGTRAYYDLLTDAQKALVTNYETLTKAEADLKALEGEPQPPADTATIKPAEAALIYKDTRMYGAVYAQNGITAILQAATPGSSIPTLSSFAANNVVTIAYPGMTSIEFECNIPARPLPISYAERLNSSIGSMEGVTVTVEDNYVTVTFDAPRDFITITMTGSCKVDLITIHAESKQPEQPNKDQEAADAVAAQIEALGTVTLQSESAIKAARGAYDALTDAQKALVTNYETLTAAEGRLQELKKEAETPVVPAGDNAIMFFALAALSMTAMAVLVAKKREF